MTKKKGKKTRELMEGEVFLPDDDDIRNEEAIREYPWAADLNECRRTFVFLKLIDTENNKESRTWTAKDILERADVITKWLLDGTVPGANKPTLVKLEEKGT